MEPAIACKLNGKAILANFTDDQVRQIIPGETLEAMTENTTKSARVLMDELEDVRRKGFATNIEESQPGIGSVDVAIVDRAARIVGFGVNAGMLDGTAVCRMFSYAIAGALTLPRYVSSDHDPLFEFHHWRANLRGDGDQNRTRDASLASVH